MKKIVLKLLSIPPKQAEYIALRALTISAIVAVLLSLSKLCVGCAIKADHKRAVQNYTENNTTTIIQNADGSTTVQGYSNGEPFGYIENNTFCDGITLDGIAISGNTFDEVRKDYYERFNQFKSSIYYSVSSGDSGYIIDASALDLTSNVDEVLLEAMRVGRESDTDFLANYNRRLEVSENGLEFTTTVSYNEEALQEFIDNIADELDIAPVEPYITMRNLVGGGKPGVVQEDHPPMYTLPIILRLRVSMLQRSFSTTVPPEHPLTGMHLKKAFLNPIAIKYIMKKLSLFIMKNCPQAMLKP